MEHAKTNLICANKMIRESCGISLWTYPIMLPKFAKYFAVKFFFLEFRNEVWCQISNNVQPAKAQTSLPLCTVWS